MRSRPLSSPASDYRPGVVAVLCLLRFLCLAAPAAAEAEESPVEPTYRFIINYESDVQELSREDIADIFLGKMTLWEDDTRIRPAMLADRTEVTREFVTDVLRRTARQFRVYWRKRLFAGRGAGPKTSRTSAKVIDFVSEHAGAIAVISADEYVRTAGIRPLDITPDDPDGDASQSAAGKRED